MITIEKLCKAYNDKILFKNFHLEIPDSRFLVISGESGCGKSTLLNMMEVLKLLTKVLLL